VIVCNLDARSSNVGWTDGYTHSPRQVGYK